jgi:hypothetical protein
MPVHLVRRVESQAKRLRSQRCRAVNLRVGPLENDIEGGLLVSVRGNLEARWVEYLFEGEPGDGAAVQDRAICCPWGEYRYHEFFSA